MENIKIMPIEILNLYNFINPFLQGSTRKKEYYGKLFSRFLMTLILEPSSSKDVFKVKNSFTTASFKRYCNLHEISFKEFKQLFKDVIKELQKINYEELDFDLSKKADKSYWHPKIVVSHGQHYYIIDSISVKKISGIIKFPKRFLK